MIIGITGGVGTGKSTVLGILKEKYNAYIIEADKVGHMLMTPGHACYDDIRNLFGNEILTEDGTIDRKELGAIVFKDNKKLEALNHIIHPAVENAIINQIKEIQQKDPDALIVIEAALLIEAGYRSICDKFWYVYADYEVRKKRLMESRGYSENKIEEIINNQLSDDEFKQMCDEIIDNSNSMEQTLAQIEKILEF